MGLAVTGHSSDEPCSCAPFGLTYPEWMRSRAPPAGVWGRTRSSRHGGTLDNLHIRQLLRRQSAIWIEIQRAIAPCVPRDSSIASRSPHVAGVSQFPGLHRVSARRGRIEIPPGRTGVFALSDRAEAFRAAYADRMRRQTHERPMVRVCGGLQVRKISRANHPRTSNLLHTSTFDLRTYQRASKLKDVLNVAKREPAARKSTRDHAASSSNCEISVDRPVRRDRVID